MDNLEKAAPGLTRTVNKTGKEEPLPIQKQLIYRMYYENGRKLKKLKSKRTSKVPATRKLSNNTKAVDEVHSGEEDISSNFEPVSTSDFYSNIEEDCKEFYMT